MRILSRTVHGSKKCLRTSAKQTKKCRWHGLELRALAVRSPHATGIPELRGTTQCQARNSAKHHDATLGVFGDVGGPVDVSHKTLSEHLACSCLSNSSCASSSRACLTCSCFVCCATPRQWSPFRPSLCFRAWAGHLQLHPTRPT